MSEPRRLRGQRIGWLLSMLTGVLAFLIFVFAPLQAMGITAFHLFADGLLLAIIVSMVIISNRPNCLGPDVNGSCLESRRILPAHLLSCVLSSSHFGGRMVDNCLHVRRCRASGRIQARSRYISPDCWSHPSIPADRGRICNAVLVCRASGPGRDQGNSFRGRSIGRSVALLHELCHADIDWVRRHHSGASGGTKSLQHRKRDRSTLSGTPPGEARYPRIKQHRLSAQATSAT